MLIAKPAKRDLALFAIDARFDLFANAEKIGALVYLVRPEIAIIDLRGETYRAARKHRRKDEWGVRAAARFLRGQEAPPNPFVLIDSSPRPLASALEEGGRIAIDAGGETFELRRRSPFSHRYDLSRESNSTPLGSAGHKSLFSNSLTVDLPSEVPEWLQAFLLALLYDRTFVESDNLSGTSG